MTKLLLVGIGGMAGAIMRYLVGTLVTNLASGIAFPFGTFAVNLLGCLLIGFLARLDFAYHLFSPEVRLLLFTGFLGAFTTFSTFSSEAFLLFQSDRSLDAMLYILSSIGLGLGAVWLGQRFAALV